MSEFKKTFLSTEDSLEKAIETLHKAGLRIALVVDSQSVLQGTITDGDIRRALLQQKKMDTPVLEIMNDSPITALKGTSTESILILMKEKDILHVPVVDSNGHIVDLKTITHIHEDGRLNNPVMIMAGGFGKRLMPLTNETPKPLLKIGSKPILESILERFIDFGFYNFFISTYYKSEMIMDYFKDGSKWGVSIKYITETKPLGTAGSLSLLPQDLPDLPLILMNGDLVTELDFQSLLENHSKSKSEVTVCVVEYDFQVPYGVLEVKGSKVKKIVEKPTHKFFVNAGIYVINTSLIKSLRKEKYLDMPELITMKIDTNNRVNMFPLYEEWLDIGRISDFRKANNKSLLDDQV